MHALAIHATFPDIYTTGSLQLDSSQHSTATSAAVLRFAASLSAITIRSLTITHVIYLGDCHQFLQSLTTCCTLPTSVNIYLLEKRINIRPVLEALANNTALTELTLWLLCSYSWNDVMVGCAKSRTKAGGAGPLVAALGQLAGLQSLCVWSHCSVTGDPGRLQMLPAQRTRLTRLQCSERRVSSPTSKPPSEYPSETGERHFFGACSAEQCGHLSQLHIHADAFAASSIAGLGCTEDFHSWKPCMRSLTSLTLRAYKFSDRSRLRMLKVMRVAS